MKVFFLLIYNIKYPYYHSNAINSLNTILFIVFNTCFESYFRIFHKEIKKSMKNLTSIDHTHENKIKEN